MKIAFFEIQGWEKRILKKALIDHQVLFFDGEIDSKNIDEVKDFDAVSVFIYSNLNKEVLSKLTKLKLITTRSTGFDHIDIKECKKRKITVCNVPFYGENTVAEHTFALMLALSRNVHKSYLRTIRNDFSIDGLIGFDLKGKTLGVVGAGHIGLHVIRMAKGFGMEVVAFDPYKNDFLAEVLDFQYDTLDNVLKKSDIITLHVPHNEHTHHLINKDSIAMMKHGAILINTARGPIVDTDALLDALESGQIAGAGLDVVEGEDLIKEEKQLLYENQNVESLKDMVRNHVLFGRDDVVFTPHIAFYSQEALSRIIETTAENIVKFSKGNIQNPVE